MSSYLAESDDATDLIENDQIQQDRKVSEKEKMKTLFIDKNPEESSSLCSKLFFSWTGPVL